MYTNRCLTLICKHLGIREFVYLWNKDWKLIFFIYLANEVVNITTYIGPTIKFLIMETKLTKSKTTHIKRNREQKRSKKSKNILFLLLDPKFAIFSILLSTFAIHFVIYLRIYSLEIL